MEITPIERFRRALHGYFQAEKKGSIVLLLWGLIAAVSGVYLFFQMGTPASKGISYPLAGIAIVHLTVGATIFFRTPKQVRALEEGLNMFPKEMLASEKERMNLVMANFERYKNIELLLFLLGFTFLLGGAFWGFGEFMLGTGAGLSVQAALTLIFDLFAAFRGGFYLRALNKFENTIR